MNTCSEDSAFSQSLGDLQKDFDGKVVSFDADGETLALEKISFRNLIGRVFVWGIIPKGATTNDWACGLSSGIAWDTVSDFMIFDNLEDYSVRMERSEPEQE